MHESTSMLLQRCGRSSVRWCCAQRSCAVVVVWYLHQPRSSSSRCFSVAIYASVNLNGSMFLFQTGITIKIASWGSNRARHRSSERMSRQLYMTEQSLRTKYQTPLALSMSYHHDSFNNISPRTARLKRRAMAWKRFRRTKRTRGNHN